MVNDVAMRNRCVPKWIRVSETGPQHQKVDNALKTLALNIFILFQTFTWKLTLGNFTTCGIGPKKIAR